MNLANQNAQGTRSKVVGQLSDLIQKCPYKEYTKWKEWYLAQQPHAIDDATKKVFAMIEELKTAINKIDESMVKKWVADLVLDKTFMGLRFQEVILKRIAKLKGSTYRLANPSEESKGIDGFIGEIPVSIKPESYKTKAMLNEEISVKIIFYEKKKSYFSLDLSQLD
ncbi:MAG TPA: MjaI family restriction endonuclease [Nanoarchaeota archaeon]|nr:MjaI family restriction endonuclease [Nanoarchaeota archaeon]